MMQNCVALLSLFKEWDDVATTVFFKSFCVQVNQKSLKALCGMKGL